MRHPIDSNRTATGRIHSRLPRFAGRFKSLVKLPKHSSGLPARRRALANLPRVPCRFVRHKCFAEIANCLFGLALGEKDIALLALFFGGGGPTVHEHGQEETSEEKAGGDCQDGPIGFSSWLTCIWHLPHYIRKAERLTEMLAVRYRKMGTLYQYSRWQLSARIQSQRRLLSDTKVNAAAANVASTAGFGSGTADCDPPPLLALLATIAINAWISVLSTTSPASHYRLDQPTP